jgi:hypothetical protein
MIRALPAPVVNGRVGAVARRGRWGLRLGLVAAAGLTGSGLVSVGSPGLAQAGPAWSVAPSPNVLRLATGLFVGVSCVSASFCMAVGDNDADQAFAARWNGSTWSFVPSPSRADSILFGVSCVLASSCTAVGFYANAKGTERTLIEAWNGSSWSVATSPNEGTGADFLNGVSCVSASSCTAVGAYRNAKQTLRTLIESWDGSTWSIVPSADNTGDNFLTGVSCVSASSCTAVGYYSVTAEGAEQTLAESWDGSTWSVVPTPSGAGDLAGVDCISASSCTAVGAGTAGTLVESWNGSTWSVVPSPNNGAAPNYLSGVSCATASFCIAVGTGNGSSLIESWNGSTWSIASTASGGTSDSSLLGASCSSASFCSAVGRSVSSVGGNVVLSTLAESWNGSTWSVVPTPDRKLFADGLAGVSCVSASFCTAVGSHISPSLPGEGISKTLAESWNGSTWSLVPSPDKYSNNNVLDAVSCSSASSCTAVGTWVSDNDAHTQTLIETWNGSTWSVVPSPDNAGTADINALAGVSCVSASFCMAVGSYTDNGTQHTLIESWNGSTWSIVPNAGEGIDNSLAAVSCVSVSSCTAVGVYSSSSDVAQTLIETWNGSSWSVVSSPNNGTGSNELAGVSCASTSSCTAVGSYANSDGIGQTLAESWDGSSWSIVSSPDNGTGANSLDSVSCSSASSCAAVGSYQSAAGVSQTLAEAWNGTTWSIQTTPDPTDGNNALLGVSCLSASSCTAAGDSYAGNGNQYTLIESYS